ncbi:MAG: NDP-sugar synthase [Candidatus Thermoplasmatota archaeon]|jgi:mannose-1-phosphate guanylyltransferase|nr:NDP-sugar synthase [Candidatus Thermoplasmatota archaeon]
MEAIILAGGFGTRLRPFTFTRAKSLLPILNEPMIAHLIKTLPKKVDTVVLAVNYRREQIEEYFCSHDFGRTIIVNEEPEPLGTGGAVKFAEKHIVGNFFVLNADIICSLNLGEMLRFHERKKAVATISLWPVENVSEFGVVDIRNDGAITKFVEKPKAEDAPSDLINAGAYLLEPQVLNYIESGKLVSMEKEIFPQIIQNTGRFFGYKFQGHWIDVGRISSYLSVHRLLLEKQKKTFIQGEQCNVYGKLQLSCVGNKVTVGKNSSIDSSVLFDEVVVGENVTMDHCVIGQNVTIGDGVMLRNVAVGDNESIRQGTSLENAVVWNQPIPEGYPSKQIGNVIGE